MTEHVVRAVADAAGVVPDRLEPPLYEAVDPDALNELFETPPRPRVRFEYADRTVVVRPDESVSVDGTVYEPTDTITFS